MLFYVQMKWNYQGRLSQDKLWDMEREEGLHAMEGVRAGVVKLYKVVSQHRIIAIVDVSSLEDLDRNSMGWLPMREYLEFEHVWALRDYEGFLRDVELKFPLPSGGPAMAGASTVPLPPDQVAEAWFTNMGSGNFQSALELLDENVDWRNISSTTGVSDVAPWLGSYNGVPAVLKSFDVWAAHSRMLSFTPQKLVVQGNEAIAIVHEHAQCLANQNEYDLYVATNLTIENGKIKKWQVYWDPSPLIAAYPKK